MQKSFINFNLAFLFVDIEGNILFIPEIRWLFHRNDLIVAHAHVAMGIAVFFMVIAMFINQYKRASKNIYLNIYLFALLGIFLVLSISGFSQAGFTKYSKLIIYGYLELLLDVLLCFYICFYKNKKILFKNRAL
jgi:cytochrome c oxidase cbb3-type subunit 1